LVVSMSKKIILDHLAWESELCIVLPASFHLDQLSGSTAMMTHAHRNS
jgi:hypothetical protein